MIRLLGLLVCLLQLASCGIQLKQTPLTDEWGRTWYSEEGRAFQDRDIYNDGSTDVWGLEKTECKNFNRIDSLAFKGTSCLRIEFNREGACPWIGLGIGWNGYVAKDISTVIETDMIEFYMRSIQGKHHSPTLIFLFEDYSGNMSAAAFKPAYLSKYPIDESWQQVRIPLSAFERKCDFSNIKSLNIECQGNAAILVDEIRIVQGSLSAKKTEKWGKVVSRESSYSLYPGNAWWGEAKLSSSAVQKDFQNTFNNMPSLSIRWKSKSDKPIQIAGFSWSNWEASKLADSLKNYEFVINYKHKSGPLPQLVLENYKGKTARYSMDSKNGTPEGEWTQTRIPLEAFKIDPSNFEITIFKQLILETEAEGEFLLGNIQLKRIKN
ncbi:MAG: hypothetical protein LCH37_04190 [Bacteroidetes bacterium]|nr:hypothetical protein [Bacteroidota bacterium]